MKDTPKSSVRDYLEWIRQLDTTVESPERPEKLPGTIMTLNIRHGGGNRVQGILDAVSTHDPDVLILTEFRENKKCPGTTQGAISSGICVYGISLHHTTGQYGLYRCQAAFRGDYVSAFGRI